MTLVKAEPMFATGDMERTIRFYTDVLGFACEGQSPEFSTVARDNVRIMFGAPNAHGSWDGPKFTGQIYVELESPAEVDALWAEIGGRVDAIYAPDDFEYGMHEFGIRDDNGYQLSFGARLPAGVG